MELELERHDWSALDSPYSNASALPDALRALAGARERAVAEQALQRVEAVLRPTEDRLTAASVATASVLVHALYSCTSQSCSFVLGLLCDLAAGFQEDAEVGQYSSMHCRCLEEVQLGFVTYVEILEDSSDLDARTACIDLILACDLANDRLTERALFFLERAREISGLEQCASVLDASISELLDRLHRDPKKGLVE